MICFKEYAEFSFSWYKKVNVRKPGKKNNIGKAINLISTAKS